MAAPRGRVYPSAMFLFFSNRMGCLGSIAVSLVLSAVIFFLMRGCSGGTVAL